MTNESRLSVALQGDYERLSDESSFIETDSVISRFLRFQIITDARNTRDAEDVRRNFLRNTQNLKKEGMMKLIQNFSPALGIDKFDLDEILEKEFCLVLSIKSMNINNFELQFTIY